MTNLSSDVLPSQHRSELRVGAVPPRLELQGISKRYPGVVANEKVTLAVQPGEIHAVLGENGAGKSTLMKIICGVVEADAGQIRFNGQTVRIRSPRQARQLGIGMVFQHFSLFETLSVAQNVWLGLDRSLSLAEVTRRIEQTAATYGMDIDPERPVHTLGVGEMQRVEIVRALLAQPRLLILDEPTSVLTPQAVDRLFQTLRQLANEGCSILYISHKLHEIQVLCHTCTVMRAGLVAGVCDPRRQTTASLSRMMIGVEPPTLKRSDIEPGEVVLELNGMDLKSSEPFGTDLYDISLQVRAGQVVGIAGVSGNGQRELLYALSGEDRRARADAVRIRGRAVGRLGPKQRRALGLHFVPEERLGRGTVPDMSLAYNLLLTREEAVGPLGWLRTDALISQATLIMARFGVKAAGPQVPARSLSGGNLQKYIIGREIQAGPTLLIVSQPTWGVDVGAAAQIRSEILALRQRGCAVLVVSEELDELFELCDQLYVLAKGHLSPPLARQSATMEIIGEWMSGLWHKQVQNHLQQVGQKAQKVSHAAS